MEQAITANAPKLASVGKRESTLDILRLNIAAMDKMLKNKDGLLPQEVDIIAEEVLQRWGGLLSFADIHVIVRNAILGVYGETYQSLTAAKVIRWFEKYADERCEESYRLNLEEDKKRERESKDGTEEEVLSFLGYKKGVDGRFSVDVDKVSTRAEKVAQNAQKVAQIKSEQIAEDNRIAKKMFETEKC